MAGAAALAVFCGIVLMGGRAVVSRPLRVLSSLYRRGLRRVASDLAPYRVVAEDHHKTDVQGLQTPVRRAA